MSSAAEPRTVQFGPRTVSFPGPALGELRRSSADEPAGDLRRRLERDGYLFLPGLLERAPVLAARERVLRSFDERGGILHHAHPRTDGVLAARCGVGCVPFIEGRNSLTHSTEVLGGVLESTPLRAFFDKLFEEPSRTFDFKWLRGVPKDAFTGAHMDWVYMGRGTRRLLTSWLPFGSNPLEMGGIAVLEGSHRLPGFAHMRATYGEMDVERDGLDGTGWFSQDPAEMSRFDPSSRWLAADYAPGDVLVFGPHTVHMSTTNVTDRVRVSCDVRWQPASCEADPRYVGAIDLEVFSKKGLHSVDLDGVSGGAGGSDADDGSSSDSPAPVSKRRKKASTGEDKAKVTMGELKRRWGLEPPAGLADMVWPLSEPGTRATATAGT